MFSRRRPALSLLIFSLLSHLPPSLATNSSSTFSPTCPPIPADAISNNNNTTLPLGTCPQSFSLLGPRLEPVHQSTSAPTGLAVDPLLNIYLTYPRNSGPTPFNVVLATSFHTETPWPSAAIQNCSAGQDPSTCFINVQNVVLDSENNLWAVDSGIPPNSPNASAIPGGAKIMCFSTTTRALLKTFTIPSAILTNGTNLNDLRVNNTLNYAFLTDASASGSLLTISLSTGRTLKRLAATPFVRADPGYVGSYNGQPVYSWNGTARKPTTTGADGIALAGGNVYWAVLASRRWYYVAQSVLVDEGVSEEALGEKVVFPGQTGTETAGLSADDAGRVYLMASEQNAVYYADTKLANRTKVGGGNSGQSEHEPEIPYVVKTLVRSAQIQHADSAAIMRGWLYFCTNQLELSPGFQYGNVDRRRGPFRSYRVWIGRGPAV